MTNIKKLKILFVAPYIPSRIRVRPYHFIKGLSKRGHSVTFIGMAGPYANREAIEDLTKYCEEIRIFRKSKMHSYCHCLLNLVGGMPLQSAYCFSAKMKRGIEEITLNSNFDILQIEHIRAGYFLPENRNIPAIYDSVDCIFSLYQQFKLEKSSNIHNLITSIELKKLAKFEPLVLSKYDAVLTTTSRDKFHLERLSQKANCMIPEISVVENGVDGEYFKAQDASLKIYSIVFAGKIGYYANEMAALHFANKIFPKIKSKIPDATFYIVGANPSKAIKQLDVEDGITVTGWVPDIRRYLRFAHVVVCPLRVTVGIQNKLLEAMSMGKTVITYPEAAFALKSDNKKVFLVAGDPEDFGDKVITVMNNESLCSELTTNARAYTQKFHVWDEKIKKLEELYLKTIDEYNTNARSRKN